MVSAIKDVDKDSYVKIAISSITIREDQGFKDKNSGVNNNLKNYFNSAGMNLIDNSNIDRSCLNRVKVLLNRKETAALAKNLCRFPWVFPVDWIITGCEAVFIRDEVNSWDNHSDISKMKNLRLKNPKIYNFFVPEYKLSSEYV